MDLLYLSLLGGHGKFFATQLGVNVVRLIRHSCLDGVLAAEVPNPVELSETGAANKEVDGCKRVVDGGDNERVSDPDHARSCQSDVLGDRDLVSWSREILESSGDQAPLHDGSPKED